jgi:hypothetical protein
MRRRSGGHAKTVHALIPGAAAPLPIKHLKSNPGCLVLRIRGARSSHLFETVIAGPALFGRAVMRTRRDVEMEILGVTPVTRQQGGQSQTQ